jgi:aldose 1-epimerase
VLVEVGATLREYTVDGQPVIDGFNEDEMADGGRGQPLLPWPNRLADGQYTFDGQQLQLPIDELSRRNASHGLTRWLNWQVASHEESTAAFELLLHPRPGYPFTLELRVEYALAQAGMTCTTTAHNRGERALPYGAGFHPYLTVGTPTVNEALLQVPATGVLAVDDRLLPTGTVHDVSDSDLDFRAARRIGEQRIDACYTDLQRDGDGLARVVLRAPSGGALTRLWADASFRYLQVYTGDSLPAERRRRGVAIEPMTCPPNAFRTGTDLIRLEPGEQHGCLWGLTT